MKKAAKKLFAVLLALAMLSTLAVPVFAADPPAADLSGHTFDVYQIFKGTVAAKAGDNGLRLSNAEWGDGIVQSLFVPDIAAYTLFEKNPFTSFTTTTTAAEVVAVMENWAENDSKNALNFARRAYFCINKGTANRHSSQNGTSITFNEDGYYLIVDATSTHNKDQARNFSNLILAKAGTSIEVTPKVVKPTVTKQVQTNTGDLGTAVFADSASHAINEPFYFKLTATLPASTAYKYYRAYRVQFNDTHTAGITLDDFDTNLTVQIKCRTKTATLTAGTDYTLTSTTTPAGFTLYIQLINEFAPTTGIIVADLETSGAEIEVTYKAHLNESADAITYPAAGTTANVTNKNSVTLHYSNSPNEEKPLDIVHGTTTAAAAYVATFGVNNTKYADNLPDDGGAALAGAEFKLYTDPTCSADKEVKLYQYTDGNYYPINSATGKTEATMVSADTTGKFNICGLDAGTYYLQETKAPDGYNTCEKIEIKINATLTGDTVDLTNAKGMVNNIVDYSGVVLPSTGGMGTTIFYVVGGLLMVGAAVLLVTKKRMQKN